VQNYCDSKQLYCHTHVKANDLRNKQGITERRERSGVDTQLISPHLLHLLIEIITISEYPLSEANFETQTFPILTQHTTAL